MNEFYITAFAIALLPAYLLGSVMAIATDKREWWAEELRDWMLLYPDSFPSARLGRNPFRD